MGEPVRMRLVFDAEEATITDIKEVNSSFAVASLSVMYTGKNRNKSDISRNAVEKALPTIYNTPIVCNWDPEQRTIGGHDLEVFKDADGNLRVRNVTVPCGVVTDHTKFSFQTRKDSKGVEREYLVADNVVLWKRQDVYEYITNDLNGVVSHSMEIEVKSGGKNEESGYYDVNDFEFTALCLLGEDHTPCFEGSQLQVFSDQNIKQEIATMMSELKECYSLIASAEAVDNTKKSTEGGENLNDEKMALIEEFGLSADALDFDIESLSIEELRAKFEEMKSADEDSSVDNTSTEDAADTSTSCENAENFDLATNIADAMHEAVSSQRIQRDWGEYPAYFFRDYDASVAEVYAESAEDWNLYGFKYSMDGDKVVIDWESKTRKKYAIVDYNEGDSANAASASALYDLMESAIVSASAGKAEAEAKVEEFSAKFTEMESELNELREFKSSVESNERTEKAQEIFAQFEDLVGNETFEALRTAVAEDNAKYDADTLEEKCFAIRGRVGVPTTFSMKKTDPKIVVAKDEDDTNMPYGGVVEKYAGK